MAAEADGSLETLVAEYRASNPDAEDSALPSPLAAAVDAAAAATDAVAQTVKEGIEAVHSKDKEDTGESREFNFRLLESLGLHPQPQTLSGEAAEAEFEKITSRRRFVPDGVFRIDTTPTNRDNVAFRDGKVSYDSIIQGDFRPWLAEGDSRLGDPTKPLRSCSGALVDYVVALMPGLGVSDGTGGKVQPWEAARAFALIEGRDTLEGLRQEQERRAKRRESSNGAVHGGEALRRLRELEAGSVQAAPTVAEMQRKLLELVEGGITNLSEVMGAFYELFPDTDEDVAVEVFEPFIAGLAS